uniref:TMC domain-containing protein n=1 Tax=Biomphalaria glabrata TaxID=6526 RepID=A0A2C9KC11_BIOGL
MAHYRNRMTHSSLQFVERGERRSKLVGSFPEVDTHHLSHFKPAMHPTGDHSEQHLPSSKTKERELTEKDLKWKLKYAHLYPKTNWMKEIRRVTNANVKTYALVLRSLPESPMNMPEKILLNRQLKDAIKHGVGSRKYHNIRHSIKVVADASQKLQRNTSNSFGFRGSGFSPLVLWGDTIGKITANFGTNVASYFSFLRFLVLLNTLMCILMFCFVSLPQIITLEVNDDNISGFFMKLSSTIFFYGAYSNSSIEHGPSKYNRPLAYLTTWSCANLLAVLIIVISMFVKYKTIKGYNFKDSEPYSSCLFTSWDHSVTNRNKVEKMKGFIANYFKETKKEEEIKERSTASKKVNLYLIRIVCNVVSICVLGGSAYLIYWVASHTITPELAVPKEVNDFILKYQLTLLVSLLKILIPPLLSLLLYIEKYHPRTQIKVKIARTAAFYVASLVVFLASLYELSRKCALDVADDSTVCCWENEVGENLFQIIILDLVLGIVVGVVITGGQAFLYFTGILRRFGRPDFNVANLILDLVYGQALIWLGLFAAPFLAFVGLIKLTIIFYFNYGLVWLFCEPNNVFRASRSGTFYMFILLTTHFVCLFPMTYAIIKLKPSDACGPFRTKQRVYEVLTHEIGVSPDWIYDIIQFCSTPAVIIPVIIFLILVTLYYKVKSSTLHAETKELRHHLEFERKEGKRNVYAAATRLVSSRSVPNDLNELGISRSIDSHNDHGHATEANIRRNLNGQYQQQLDAKDLLAKDGQGPNKGHAPNVQINSPSGQSQLLKAQAPSPIGQGIKSNQGNGHSGQGLPSKSLQQQLDAKDLLAKDGQGPNKGHAPNVQSNSPSDQSQLLKAQAPSPIGQGIKSIQGNGHSGQGLPSKSLHSSTDQITRPQVQGHVHSGQSAPLNSIHTNNQSYSISGQAPSTVPGSSSVDTGLIIQPWVISDGSSPTASPRPYNVNAALSPSENPLIANINVSPRKNPSNPTSNSQTPHRDGPPQHSKKEQPQESSSISTRQSSGIPSKPSSSQPAQPQPKARAPQPPGSNFSPSSQISDSANASSKSLALSSNSKAADFPNSKVSLPPSNIPTAASSNILSLSLTSSLSPASSQIIKSSANDTPIESSNTDNTSPAISNPASSSITNVSSSTVSSPSQSSDINLVKPPNRNPIKRKPDQTTGESLGAAPSSKSVHKTIISLHPDTSIHPSLTSEHNSNQLDEPTHYKDQIDEPTHYRDQIDEPTHYRDQLDKPTHYRDQLDKPTHYRDQLDKPTHYRDQLDEPTHYRDQLDEPRHSSDYPYQVNVPADCSDHSDSFLSSDPQTMAFHQMSSILPDNEFTDVGPRDVDNHRNQPTLHLSDDDSSLSFTPDFDERSDESYDNEPVTSRFEPEPEDGDSLDLHILDLGDMHVDKPYSDFSWNDSDSNTNN